LIFKAFIVYTMTHKIDIAIPGPDDSTIQAHLFLPEHEIDVPVFVFCHGFKGFRDWGFFPHIADTFCPNGIAVLTFNHVFNGVDEVSPQNFTRLDLFAKQTVTREHEEIQAVLDWLKTNAEGLALDIDNVTLGGHSRGAANALVVAAANPWLAKVVAWAPIAYYAAMFASVDSANWQQQGFINIPNVRTGKDMPLSYNYWQDLIQHAEKQDILEAAGSLKMPLLIVHGTNDKSVPLLHAEKIYDECWHALLIKIENADHTFNTAHPFVEPLCDQTEELLENTLDFILE
jgi:pimeloyl-ACP methyl ester carboxylesterase